MNVGASLVVVVGDQNKGTGLVARHYYCPRLLYRKTMDSGRTEHRRESEHVAPRGRCEEQRVEICGQNSKKNIAEGRNLAISDGTDSDEDGSTAVCGSNLPIYIAVMQARDLFLS